MKTIKRQYYLVETLYGVGISLFSAVIYLYMKKIGYSINEINFYVSAFWFISFFAEIPSGVFADSFGRRNTSILSCLVRGSGLLVLVVFPPGFWVVCLSGFLTAVGSALYSGAMESWVIDELQKIDPDIDLAPVFSRSTVIATTASMAAGFVGAQVLGVINLAYPILFAGIELFLTAAILLIFLPNDNPNKTSETVGQSFDAYKANLMKGLSDLKGNRPFIFYCVGVSFLSFIITPAFNQWQLYFKDSHLGMIAGYIHVFNSLFGMAGAELAGRVKSKYSGRFLRYSLVAIFGTLVLSVLVQNIYIALAFFFLHVMSQTAMDVVAYTYVNDLLTNDTRTSLMSCCYALDSIVTVVIMTLNGWLNSVTSLGMSWIILGVVGLAGSLPIFIYLSRQNPKAHQAQV